VPRICEVAPPGPSGLHPSNLLCCPMAVTKNTALQTTKRGINVDEFARAAAIKTDVRYN
jgi:hypothetical protein